MTTPRYPEYSERDQARLAWLDNAIAQTDAAMLESLWGPGASGAGRSVSKWSMADLDAQRNRWAREREAILHQTEWIPVRIRYP